MGYKYPIVHLNVKYFFFTLFVILNDFLLRQVSKKSTGKLQLVHYSCITNL